ncbi:MAG: serine hydrolase [Phycisphaerae bacterium]
MRIAFMAALGALFVGHMAMGQTSGESSGAGGVAPKKPVEATQPGASHTAPALQTLGSRWQGIMKELHVPGMAVAAVRGDKVVLLEGFGTRDPRTKAPVTPDTIFFLADSTRPFVAMEVLKLAEEGLVDLDTPVKSYLPRFMLAAPELAAAVTVRDLLCLRWDINSFVINIAASFTGEMDDDLFYDQLSRVRARERFTRTNVPYITLGRMIDAAAGMSWKDYLNKRILAPAGMDNTFCSASRMYASSNVAMPVEEVDGEWHVSTTLKTDRTMHAGGGIGSSASDLVKWLRLNLNGGRIDGRRILPENSVKEMQTQQVAAPRRIFEFEGKAYGLGWYLGSYKGNRLVYHIGMFPGYRSHISFMPERGVGVAVLVNSSEIVMHFADFVACDVYDRLFNLQGEDLHERLREKAYEESDRRVSRSPSGPNPAKGGLTLDPRAYVGKYVSKTWGTLDMTYDGDLLTAKIGDLVVPMFSTGPDWFTAVVGARTLSGRFEMTDDKRVTAVILERGPVEMNFKR